MNNAGLPGTGLGGLFYVVLALGMPVAELVATVRGRSSRRRWRFVLGQFGLGCAIVAAVVATVLVLRALPGAPLTPVPGLPPVVMLLAAPTALVAIVVVLRVWSALGSGHRADPAHAE
jgi:hypothetical protein